MISAAAVALSLHLFLGGSADDLMSAKFGAVQLQVPAAWKKSLDAGSPRYVAPSGDAYFLVNVDHTLTALDPGVCRQKILEKMGGDPKAWTLLSIGAAPAARKSDVDRSADGKTEAETLTYVGCDGVNTWSLVFHLMSSKRPRFEPLAEKIARSVSYTGAAK